MPSKVNPQRSEKSENKGAAQWPREWPKLKLRSWDRGNAHDADEARLGGLRKYIAVTHRACKTEKVCRSISELSPSKWWAFGGAVAISVYQASGGSSEAAMKPNIILIASSWRGDIKSCDFPVPKWGNCRIAQGTSILLWRYEAADVEI